MQVKLSGTLLRKPSVKVVDVDEGRQGYPTFFPSFQIFILGLWLCCLPGFSTNFSADEKPPTPKSHGTPPLRSTSTLTHKGP